MVLQLVILQPLGRRHGKRATFAAEEKIAAVRSKKGELLFGEGVDVMFQMSRGCPLSVAVEADVEVAARIGLTTRTQLFRPVRVGRRANPGRGED